MKYMITMTDREGVWDGLSQSRQQEVLQQHAQYRQALEDSGKFLHALHLYPRDEAITVRLDENGARAEYRETGTHAASRSRAANPPLHRLQLRLTTRIRQ